MKKFEENNKILKNHSFGLDSDAVSHNECTGLVAFAPVNDDQLENYDKIQHYAPKPLPKKK